MRSRTLRLLTSISGVLYYRVFLVMGGGFLEKIKSDGGYFFPKKQPVSPLYNNNVTPLKVPRPPSSMYRTRPLQSIPFGEPYDVVEITYFRILYHVEIQLRTHSFHCYIGRGQETNETYPQSVI